jgi:hypothetical protein
MVWTGELSEKLQYMIEYTMIPELLSTGMIAKHDNEQSQTPVCTLVFDREAYEPKFFTRLWDLYRIAIITYRKNVKDKWELKDFTEMEVLDNLNNKKTMHLGEKPIELNGNQYREIRCLASREHQTAMITTHPTLDMKTTALTLFNRWQQENFFKYMLADYSLDHLVEYGTEHIDLESKIVNPAYRVINYQLKKEKEKLQRLKATLLKKVNLNTTQQLDQFKESIEAKAILLTQIEAKQKVVNELIIDRDKIPAKIKLGQLPEEKRYTKLKTESAYFMSTLKMICYRAESAIANLLHDTYGRFTDEKRMFIKNIINTPADLIPDLKSNTLTVKLHSLNTPKANELITHICKTLNESETMYPGTNLKMIYEPVLN